MSDLDNMLSSAAERVIELCFSDACGFLPACTNYGVSPISVLVIVKKCSFSVPPVPIPSVHN